MGDSVLAVNDDGFSSAQYVEAGFPFFNVTRSVLFVSSLKLNSRLLCALSRGSLVVQCSTFELRPIDRTWDGFDSRSGLVAGHNQTA